MMTMRPSGTRGHAKHGWLDSYHSFSFADYYDANHMQFSCLRVINEDKIAPNAGFGMHGHRDMEIVTYMIAGELRHTDSLGNGSVIKAGDVQRMTAGSGIRHSEVNTSDTQTAHLLQIWLLPNQLNLTPSYEELHFNRADKLNQWCLIAALNSAKGVLHIHQDLQLFATILAAGENLTHTFKPKRSAYLQVVKGEIRVNRQLLKAGDALMLEDETELQVCALQEAEAILFDLPAF